MRSVRKTKESRKCETMANTQYEKGYLFAMLLFSPPCVYFQRVNRLIASVVFIFPLNALTFELLISRADDPLISWPLTWVFRLSTCPVRLSLLQFVCCFLPFQFVVLLSLVPKPNHCDD